jgi:hypothetical protein
MADALPWDALWRWGERTLSVEGQEMLLSLLLEPHGALVDDLAETMGADEIASFRIAGQTSVASLRETLLSAYGWALELDYANPDACARFWYVSEAKLEPRLGERQHEPGADLEQPLDIARAAAALEAALRDVPDNTPLAAFLRDHPEHRRMARRAQMAQWAPYSEIRDNLISAEMTPIDLLRCKLAFFGATRFDPRSDRWVRITMYQDAPLPDELHMLPEDDWVFPAGAEQAA